MSMDLEVWSENPFNLETMLIESNKWEKFGDEWAYEGNGWQVLINIEESNDSSDSVQSFLPSPNYVAFISLEPIGADSSGYLFLEKTIRGLAKESNGVWVDPNGEAFRPGEGTFE